MLTALVFTLWPLARTEDVRPAMLFRDALDGASVLPAARYVIATLILLAGSLASRPLFREPVPYALDRRRPDLGALAILIAGRHRRSAGSPSAA